MGTSLHGAQRAKESSGQLAQCASICNVCFDDWTSQESAASDVNLTAQDAGDYKFVPPSPGRGDFVVRSTSCVFMWPCHAEHRVTTPRCAS